VSGTRLSRTHPACALRVVLATPVIRAAFCTLRRPPVVVMKPSQDGPRHDFAIGAGGWPFVGSPRDPLADALMWPRLVEILESILAQHPPQLLLPQNHDVVETLATYTAQKPLDDGIAVRRLRRDLHDVDAHAVRHGVELFAELAVVVSDEVLRPLSERRRLPQLLSGPRVAR
jgi:hypothetical protein